MTSTKTFEETLAESSQVSQGSEVLPLLADPSTYRACIWDLSQVAERRAYWLNLFRTHLPKLLAEAVKEAADRGEDMADAQQRAAQANARFNVLLDELPEYDHYLTILQICFVREAVIREVGFNDPYRLAKSRENEAALTLLPRVLSELDEMAEVDRWDALIKGVFAGNIFDLGATQTAALFDDGQSIDFHEVRMKLAPRPWLFDDYDSLMTRLNTPGQYKRALLFVDNAGCDIVLGMIPLARQLVRAGTKVILTANTLPTLNDVTHDELTALIDQIAQWDSTIRDALESGQLRLVPSGNGVPLIDLSRVSPELVQVVNEDPIDLCILEGMGRGVESNLNAQLTCDTLKIAMLKDKGVAEALGGKLYDLVLKFDSN